MPSASMRFITPAGSKAGMVTILEPAAGITSKLAMDAAWNSGVWLKNTSSFLVPPSPMATWYTLSISARCWSSTPLGRPVVPPVYMSTTGSSSSGSGGVVSAPAATKSS